MRSRVFRFLIILIIFESRLNFAWFCIWVLFPICLICHQYISLLLYHLIIKRWRWVWQSWCQWIVFNCIFSLIKIPLTQPFHLILLKKLGIWIHNIWVRKKSRILLVRYYISCWRYLNTWSMNWWWVWLKNNTTEWEVL